MPSVGPQLPPHLRQPSSESTQTTGPQLPAHLQQQSSASTRNVGPQLPPHLQKRKRSYEDEDDSDSSSSTSPPPSKIRATTPPPKRVLGPSAPPAPLDEHPAIPADAEASSSEDEDYGPSLPPAPGSAAALAHSRRSAALASASENGTKTAKPQREEWMLVPPSSSDWTSRVDPTKLKARKFASGKGGVPASGGGGGEKGIAAIWTETPEEKRRRLADEVLGRVDGAASNSGAGKRNGSQRATEDADAEAEATSRRIAEYNERNRGRSLMDEHAGGKTGKGKKEEEDDPSKREFDKEKDMALGGRVGHVQKRELLKKAGDFGSRFERGSYL